MSDNSVLTEYAKQLRHNQTKAESVLWDYLRAGRFSGIKFKRQFVIANYIVDFYCSKAKIAIEIDGDDHYDEEHQEYDARRSIVLNSKEIAVLRYTNREIVCETENVLKDIFRNIENTRLFPSPE